MLVFFGVIYCNRPEIKENNAFEDNEGRVIFDLNMLGDSASYLMQLETLFLQNPK